MPPTNVKGLYLLTEDGASETRLAAVVPAALAAGVTWLQYRDKSRDPALRLRQATRLAQWCDDAGAGFIVNDDVALARAVGAAGVHLGRDDGDLRAARDTLGPEAVIGASCYDDLDRAARARDAGASYLAFGAVFPSGTKPGARTCPMGVLGAARSLGRPVVAIGGIDANRAASVLAAGADALAVLGAIWQAADPAAEVTRFLESMNA